jgi:hypothetical protein
LTVISGVPALPVPADRKHPARPRPTAQRHLTHYLALRYENQANSSRTPGEPAVSVQTLGPCAGGSGKRPACRWLLPQGRTIGKLRRLRLPLPPDCLNIFTHTAGEGYDCVLWGCPRPGGQAEETKPRSWVPCLRLREHVGPRRRHGYAGGFRFLPGRCHSDRGPKMRRATKSPEVQFGRESAVSLSASGDHRPASHRRRPCYRIATASAKWRAVEAVTGSNGEACGRRGWPGTSRKGRGGRAAVPRRSGPGAGGDRGTRIPATGRDRSEAG